MGEVDGVDVGVEGVGDEVDGVVCCVGVGGR